MPKTFRIVTLGCKVNQYESAYLKEALIHAGYREARAGEHADVAVVNTCVVTQRAAHQSRQAIRKAVRENPEALVAAAGCYAQIDPDELATIEGLSLIAGNREKAGLPGELAKGRSSKKPAVMVPGFEKGMPFEFLPITRFPGRKRAFVKIQDGCESFCSYCLVPLARGPYRSLPLRRVLSLIASLAEAGYKEIVLTGIHLGKYGVDLPDNTDLKGLLCAAAREGLPLRIRLSSIEPNEIDDGLIDLVQSETWLCRHFHIPLQSGHDAILKAMNRQYTAREFARLVERIHAKIPFAAIGADVLAGFPGEDASAHQSTMSIIGDLPLSYLHVFPFSGRPGTPAYGFEAQNDPQTIKGRAAEMRALGQRKRHAFYERCLHKEFQVLVEGWDSPEKKTLTGITDNYLPVVFPSSEDLTGELVAVRMKTVETHRLAGYGLGCIDSRVQT